MAMRSKVKKKVPHLVTAFITERMDVIGEHWLFGTMNAKISWSREEWQARDEKHRHGLGQHAMKLNHRQNAEIAVAGKRAQFLLKQDTTEPSQRAALEEQVANGKAAEQKVVRAVDLLVSNCHPDVDSLRGVWQNPVPHPCTIPYAEVLRDFNDARKAQHETGLWNVVVGTPSARRIVSAPKKVASRGVAFILEMTNTNHCAKLPRWYTISRIPRMKTASQTRKKCRAGYSCAW